ncbi:hypothetical protein SF83666_c34070 [Sinorhizobium fredii CCBAU 83666]|nr:hypothetical protein SF83666_c34070 [Sinorhizobium fredii CCBAU 83666]
MRDKPQEPLPNPSPAAGTKAPPHRWEGLSCPLRPTAISQRPGDCFAINRGRKGCGRLSPSRLWGGVGEG